MSIKMRQSSCVLVTLILAIAAPLAHATTWGPYNADFPAASDGLRKTPQQSKLFAGAEAKRFTLSAWIRPSDVVEGRVLIAGAGQDPQSGWFLGLVDGKPALLGGGIDLVGYKSVQAGQWTHLVATGDGKTLRLFVNGRLYRERTMMTAPTPADSIALAPRQAGVGFAGKIAQFVVSDEAMSATDIRRLSKTLNEDLINFETGSPTWPIQVRQMYGQVEPQDAWTLPKSRADTQSPQAKPSYDGPALVEDEAGSQIIKAWRLQAAPVVSAKPEGISLPGFDAKSWYVATTPGTVLTTLVDRGVYPDPDYGLNNLSIPESLNKQDYWYRSEFATPDAYKPGQHLFVTFKGINYAAEVWINGQKLGSIKGAFIRGDFDIGTLVKPGLNAIAVKVSPVPHPGIPQEESLTAGSGNNGGAQAQDGPTFIASEGWDWIPSVRDRNTGLWQDVVLKSSGDVRLGDAHIVTALPKADNSEADIRIELPVTNLSPTRLTTRIEATIRAQDGTMPPIEVSQTVTLEPGAQSVTFAPIVVKNPKLWWPNGYGAPTLHTLNVKAFTGEAFSDATDTRFGIRQVTYELSLVDPTGHLKRVEADFTKGDDLGIRITDGSHKGIRKIADYGTNGGTWATSLRGEAQSTLAAKPLSDERLTPYLVIKVNGVRIAARGGNWGTDDWRKRVSREALEPYFRLHRDAHVNVIRNWVGQNTEDTFYDLADEYGLMVLNDFWASTQNYQLEPGDVNLFVDNARDVVKRYRNHPSIVLWFGRNEGVPQPVLNEALEDLIYKEDGTRWYTGSSNQVNLQNSGPYAFKTPESYFTEHAKGFSVEVGTASFPTLEAFKAAIPQADQWPISDAWAYHDWHPDGNGSTKPFEATLAAEFGAPSSLADFERKAQMLNLESHRAIFEGMNAGLWTKNSGRLLWMTQPAWPSSMWQILSHDYDTQASFYGVKSAAEPVHIQMNLPDRRVIVVNNPPLDLKGATATADIYALDGTVVSKADQVLDVAGVAISDPIDFGIAQAIAKSGVVIVKLTLHDSKGLELSRNVYWQGKDEAALQALNGLSAQDVGVTSKKTDKGLSVTITNPSAVPVLAVKLTVVDDKGQRILPVYYGDNYISLMPGETRSLNIAFTAPVKASLQVRGWNVRETIVP